MCVIANRRFALYWLAALAAIVAPASARCETMMPRHQVPDGFAIEQVAGEPETVFPMFACFDDCGRLFVAESSGLDLYVEITAATRKCRIRMLEDRDGDGRFETSAVFADKLVFPMGLVWRDGKLYVPDPPDLVTLEDADGDGRAEKRTVILTGFGHIDNGSLHGLTFGPDGWLYMTMGSPDGYKLRRADGSLLEGESGALIRCRPDGSSPEVLCRGFENLVEVAWTARGEAIGTDNWFRNPNTPESNGLRDALMHLTDGGLYPYHREVGTPQPVTGDPLGPVSLFPAFALSGLARYEGPQFPAEFGGNLFTAQHNSRAVGRHVLIPEGSTYRATDLPFVTTDDPDFHPSDVLEDADGSLLVVDTGSWYVQHCPTGSIRKTRATGGIWRVRRADAERPADPWGLAEDWAQATPERLCQLLTDSRPKVRERARLTLAARGASAVAVLAAALEGAAETTARQQVIWALANIADESALPTLRQALGSSDADVAATAARALAAHADRDAAGALTRLLAAEALPVRFAAAEALARCGNEQSLPAIWQALTRDADRFLEHALIHAAHRLAGDAELESALAHPHPRVQKAALLLLDQPPRPTGRVSSEMAFAKLASDDADLRRTALAIVGRHPEWAEQAVPVVRNWLAQPTLSADEARGLIGLARAFQADAALQQAVAAALTQPTRLPAERRAELLDVLAESDLPRPPPVWVEAVAGALDQHDPAIRAGAVRAAGVWQVAELDEPLARVADDASAAAELRVDALRALVARHPKPSAERFALLAQQLAETDSPLARLAAADVLGRSELTDDQRRQFLRAVGGDTLIAPASVLPAFRKDVGEDAAADLLDYLTAAAGRGWRPSEAELEAALAPLPSGTKAEPLRAELKRAAGRDLARLAEFEPLAEGGDASRGREVFFGKKVACAACHRVGREGGTIGPDLTKVGGIRHTRDLLESIVLPSATFAQGFEGYRVQLADGRIAGGVIARRSAGGVVLRDATGAETKVPAGAVEGMIRDRTSLMPDGLAKALTPGELRDLLAYLRSLK
jgi:putative membrane-bound dehydrogenase-like protein